MASWVAVACGGRVAAQIDIHRSGSGRFSSGANSSVRSTSRRWKLLCTNRSAGLSGSGQPSSASGELKVGQETASASRLR